MFFAIVCGYYTIYPPKGYPEGETILAKKLAFGLDVLAGITTLVIGILSVTAPHLGITLSLGCQWALIGVGATYTALLLLYLVTWVKFCSPPKISKKYLC